jgi:tRNA-uridine 2-sulfurtransferase
MAAMSGGVDSAVAAALALRAGHDIAGVTLKQWEFPDEETRLVKGCCTLDAVADARRAADVLGIAHYTLDLREEFSREVVDPFVADHVRGVTPNPCVRCNENVRFGVFLQRALRLGFEGIVTGHYARVERRDGRFRLRRAADRSKDQSYVLYALGQDALACAHLPIGALPSKAAVRETARELGLPNAEREDSVEVCFVGEGRRPGDVVAEREPAAVRRGPILDGDGRVLGEHRGLPYYTVGQRRGLSVSAKSARYVTAVLPERNALVVGGRDELGSRTITATRARFVDAAPDDGERFAAVVRYQGAGHAATYRPEPDGFRLELDDPARAAAPGQAVVLYDGDEVVGGGTIARAG